MSTNRETALQVIRDQSGVRSDEQIVDALIGAGLIQEPTRKDQLIRLIAEVLAGLQVAVSMPGSNVLLGTAYGPWVRIRSREQLNMFGWTDADEFEKELRQVLT